MSTELIGGLSGLAVGRISPPAELGPLGAVETRGDVSWASRSPYKIGDPGRSPRAAWNLNRPMGGLTYELLGHVRRALTAAPS